MTEPVKRYWHVPNVGFDLLDPKYYEVEPGYVHHDDYARLEQECERLRAVLEGAQYPNLDQLPWLTVEACRTIGTTVADLTIKIQAEREAALKQVEGLRAALVDARELIGRGDFDTGICCCGGDVDKHGFGDGHSPVDQGGYYALGVMQRIDAALQAKP